MLPVFSAFVNPSGAPSVLESHLTVEFTRAGVTQPMGHVLCIFIAAEITIYDWGPMFPSARKQKWTFLLNLTNCYRGTSY